MSNIIKLSARRAARALPPEKVRPVDGRAGRKLGTPNMHTFVFRSYELIMASSEADLVRDIRCDVDKARSKLKSIQQQLQRDREHAAAREDLLTKAEAKLSAAIVTAGSAIPAPASILEPPRRTNSEAMARNREFSEVMRQRIKDVAASRDLNDEQIKPAMTCKHQAINEFAKKHGVNLEWLIAGKGRIFKKDPIVLGRNMTASEFASVVATTPADRQARIRALVDEVMAERGL